MDQYLPINVFIVYENTYQNQNLLIFVMFMTTQVVQNSKNVMQTSFVAEIRVLGWQTSYWKVSYS